MALSRAGLVRGHQTWVTAEDGEQRWQAQPPAQGLSLGICKRFEIHHVMIYGGLMVVLTWMELIGATVHTVC